MLAEPKRDKRYVLQPKGKALYEDQSRFGTKMLKKMGWSEGKGLGMKEDGKREFVKIRYRNSNDGLGFKDHDDHWTQHEEGFKALLNNLNSELGTSKTKNTAAAESCSDDEESAMPTVGFGFQAQRQKSTDSNSWKNKLSGVSLEEKSKKSKSRVHYHKFAKSKDLTRYSEKDLANIFGKKPEASEFDSEKVVDSPSFNISLYNRFVKQQSNDHKSDSDDGNNAADTDNRLKERNSQENRESEPIFRETFNNDMEVEEIPCEREETTARKDEIPSEGCCKDDMVVTQSSTVTSTPSPDNHLDVYIISSYCAEKFRFINLDKFAGANIADIGGYSMSSKTDLRIQSNEEDEKRILKLWGGEINKYANKNKRKAYSKYIRKVSQAIKTKQKMPRFNARSWNRKSVFQGI